MKRTFTVAVIVTALMIPAVQSKAESGWAWRGHTWVHWHYRTHAPDSLHGRGLAVYRASEKAAAIRVGVNARKRYLRHVRAVLRRSRAILAQARSVIGSYSGAFPATCVAMAEEGGHNSTAGYFGTIYPPSAYGGVAQSLAQTYGESWLNWPWGAQLQVALDLFRRYGGSAWGPLTRSKCGI